MVYCVVPASGRGGTHGKLASLLGAWESPSWSSPVCDSDTPAGPPLGSRPKNRIQVQKHTHTHTPPPRKSPVSPICQISLPGLRKYTVDERIEGGARWGGKRESEE